MNPPSVCCFYYGKLFLETYNAAGGVVPVTAIDPVLEAAIITAAKEAVEGVRRIRGYYPGHRRFWENNA